MVSPTKVNKIIPSLSEFKFSECFLLWMNLWRSFVQRECMVVTRKIFLLDYPESLLNRYMGCHTSIKGTRSYLEYHWDTLLFSNNFWKFLMADPLFYLESFSWGFSRRVMIQSAVQLSIQPELTIALPSCASSPCCLWSWRSSWILKRKNTLL